MGSQSDVRVIDEKQCNVATADPDDSGGECFDKRVRLRGLMREQQSRHGPIAGIHHRTFSSQMLLQRGCGACV
jgi:hypothetical protein